MTLKEKFEIAKENYINTLKLDDFKSYYQYSRIESIEEVLRGMYLLPLYDTPKAKQRMNPYFDFWVFETKEVGIILDWVIIFNEQIQMFELLEMTNDAYNKYEQFLRTIDNE